MRTRCENTIHEAEATNMSQLWEFLPGNEISWTRSVICQGSWGGRGSPVAWLSWRVIWGQEEE